MKKTITFVNTTTFSSTDVDVGPEHLLVLAGTVAVIARVFFMMGDEHIEFAWFGAAVLVAHARLWRHALTLPVLASCLLGLVSFGISMLISGLILNKMIAERYRDAGWKIRNMDGELGEYSSRFLAVHELGFKESDLMASVVRTHLLDVGWRDDETPPAAAPVFSQAEGAASHSTRRPSAAARSDQEVHQPG